MFVLTQSLMLFVFVSSINLMNHNGADLGFFFEAGFFEEIRDFSKYKSTLFSINFVFS